MDPAIDDLQIVLRQVDLARPYSPVKVSEGGKLPTLVYRLACGTQQQENRVVEAVTLTRVAGYRRSPKGRQRRPIIRSITHAPDQTLTRSQLFHCCIDLAAPGRCDLTSE